MNITDGSVTWKVRDKRIKALVDLFFPVGSIIARDDDTEPEILSYGKWEKIGENRVLQGAGGQFSRNRCGGWTSEYHRKFCCVYCGQLLRTM